MPHVVKLLLRVRENVYADAAAIRQVDRYAVGKRQSRVREDDQQIRIAARHCITAGQRTEQEHALNLRPAAG